MYEFLAQAVDNELYNDEEEWESKYLPLALDVVDKLESVLADLATNEKVSNSGFCRTK